MDQVGYETLIQIVLMGLVHHNMSYVLMLTLTSHSPSWACNTELYLFTALRSFVRPNPMPSKTTFLTNVISENTSLPCLGSKTSREVVPQDVLSGSGFCSIYGHLMVLWQSKKQKQTLAYLKNRPITLGSFNTHPGKWKQTKQEAKSKDPGLNILRGKSNFLCHFIGYPPPICGKFTAAIQWP